MSKEQRLQKAKIHLNKALSEIAQTHDPSIMEARSSIRRALSKIESVGKKKKANAPVQFTEWWSNIEAGASMAATTPMSAVARQRSLSELNKMISAEEEKLKELEDTQDSDSDSNELLRD